MKLLKKLLYTFCFGASVIWLNSCGVEENKTKLEFSLEAGKTYGIEITKNIKNYELLDGSIKENSEKLSIAYQFSPESINNGTTVLKGNILSVNVVKHDQSGSVEFNSSVINANIPLLAIPYSLLVGKTFTLEIQKDGSVNKLFGMKENLKAVIDSFKISEESVKQNIAESLNEEFGDETLIETFGRMFAFYPTDAVEIGQTWEKKVRLTTKIPLIIDNDYTLAERNNGVSIIQVNSEIASDTLASKAKYSGTQNGKMQIDEISGWISKAVFSYQIHEDKSASAESNTQPRLLSSEINISYGPLPGDAFKEIGFDPKAVVKGDGLGMTLVGMGVVFSSLVLLFIVFTNLSRILKINFRKKQKPESGTAVEKDSDTQMTGEVSAAIAMAMHLYFRELHDDESTVLTIKKVSRTYSPWSSKIYGLRQYPK